MIYDVLGVVLLTLGAVVAAAILAFGFVFLIFVGDANARGKPLVSERFDRLATLTIYLSWFGPLWWFGFSEVLLMVACGATAILCLVYAASYQAAQRQGGFRRRSVPSDAALGGKEPRSPVPHPRMREAEP